MASSLLPTVSVKRADAGSLFSSHLVFPIRSMPMPEATGTMFLGRRYFRNSDRNSSDLAQKFSWTQALSDSTTFYVDVKVPVSCDKLSVTSYKSGFVRVYEN